MCATAYAAGCTHVVCSLPAACAGRCTNALANVVGCVFISLVQYIIYTVSSRVASSMPRQRRAARRLGPPRRRWWSSRSRLERSTAPPPAAAAREPAVAVGVAAGGRALPFSPCAARPFALRPPFSKSYNRCVCPCNFVFNCTHSHLHALPTARRRPCEPVR